MTSRGFLVPVFLCAAVLPAAAAVYTIPEERTIGGMQQTVLNAIPDELAKATCGWSKDQRENEAMTTVKGVPLRPATWRGKSTGDDTGSNSYPETASGLVFSAYMWHEACRPVRWTDPLCTNPQECSNVCAEKNAQLRYKVYRISSCDVHVAQYMTLPNGSVVFVGCTTNTFPTDASSTGDCNSCPESSPECSPTTRHYSFFGEKYQCTGDWDEEHDVIRDDPDGVVARSGALLRADFGWVWKDGAPDLQNAADWCKQLWTRGEDHEHRNCMPCAGKQCRTITDDPARQLDPSFDPPKDLYGDSRFYDSFYRRYTATHTPGKIPDATSPGEEDIKVQLACYNWYVEKPENTDPGVPWHLTCIADDLQLDKLSSRTVTGTDTFNRAESSSSVASQAGGFTLDPDRKAQSLFRGAAVPPQEPLPPFGETPAYVTAMQRLEKEMADAPPTVEMILPAVSVSDELRQLFPAAESTTGAAPLTDLAVPLQPGLLESVREVMRQAIFSRVREEAIPIVVPLLSETELQAVTEAWEGWRAERQLAGRGTGNADAVLAKLATYRQQIQSYRQLRAALPNVMAQVLQRRKDVSSAIDAWVQSRMAPYQQAIGERQKKLDLLAAWKNLKDEYGRLGQTNTPYCKADRTTPAVAWMELTDPFPVPAIPPLPRRFTFDFSDIFYEGSAEVAALQMPVLQPIPLALTIPLPGGTGDVTLPDLPDPPDLPSLAVAPVSVSARYGPPSTASVPPFPYDDLIEKFNARAADLRDVRQRYENYLWVKAAHPDLSCPERGSEGCVFPETKLWAVFMRVWSPIGAFLRPDEPPAGAASSVSSSAPPCRDGSDQCLLKEKLLRDGLRITLPQNAGSASSSFVENLRRTMRERAVTNDGTLNPVGQAPPYDIASPDQLYDIFALPDPAPIEHIDPSRLPCADSPYPTCGGTCPAGTHCTKALGASTCTCRS